MRVEVSNDFVIIRYGVISGGWGDKEKFYPIYANFIFGISKCLRWNLISLEIIEKIANDNGAETRGIEIMNQKKERLMKSLSNLSEKEDNHIYGLLKNEIETIDDNLSASVQEVYHNITQELTEIINANKLTP